MGVLRARVGGQWVDISANTSDVVWVDTDPPTDQATELWYDTDAVGPGSAAMVSGRNLLDNGQFNVKQRVAVSTLTMGSNVYLCDRWATYNSGVGVSTLGYSINRGFGVFPPAGRPQPAGQQYIQMTTGEAAAALSAGDWMYWVQRLEGQDLQHLNWGTADARPLTLSFDIFSNIAATYVVELQRTETSSRTVSRVVTVPQYYSTQTVTFPGDTVGVITNDTASRLQVNFWLAAGSQWTSSPLQTSWGTGTDAVRAAGVSNTIQATAGNIFGLTNVQLEIGTVATPYEVRRYSDELMRCMRYYRETARSASLHGEGGHYGYNSAGFPDVVNFPFPVPMRVAPTYTQGGVWTASNCTGPNVTTYPTAYSLNWTPTAAGAYSAYSGNNGYLIFNAEI